MTGEELYNSGYRTISNKYQLANRCTLTDTELIEWVLVKCKYMLEVWRDNYRRTCEKGRIELTIEQFNELKICQSEAYERRFKS